MPLSQNPIRHPAFAVLLVLALVGQSACVPTRGLEAWRLLDDLGAAPATDATGSARTTVSYEVAGHSYGGNLYRPTAGAKAALVLVPGAAPEGKDDPRLVATARALARARFAVLVPDLANLRALTVEAADSGRIADAARYLLRTAPADAGRPLGLVAISYAAGPAVLAALEPDLRDRVAVVVTVGGYYDIAAVVTFFTTAFYRRGPATPWQRGNPNVYGKWVFVRANAKRLDDPRDRVLLDALATRKLDDPGAPVEDLSARLGPEGRAVMALLANDDPAAVPDLIANLPAAIRDEMAALDVSRRDLTELRAALILLHGREDRIIPYTESQALAAAAPPAQTSLTLVDNLAHVDLVPPGLFDRLRLWRAAYRLLTLRDAAE